MVKSYKCNKLETTLHFLPKEIKFCCSNTKGLSINIERINSKNIKDRIIKSKKYYINLLKKGGVPQECIGCVYFSQYSKENKKIFDFKSFFKKDVFKISNIIVSHFKQCDCSCIYCSQKYLHKSDYKQYEILPIIKQLYRENLIDKKNLTVEFQGGNITMLKEFNAVIEELADNGCNKFIININGINYLEILEKINYHPSSVFTISLDAGTKETYKLIKNADAFDKTINNIRRLKNNTNAQLCLKYIIINGINDNEEELKKFLEISKDLKADSIVIDIDYRDTMMNHETTFIVPEHYYEMFKFTDKYCKENKMNYGFPDYTKSVIEKGRN